MTINLDLSERLFSVGSAYRKAKVLLSAVELDLFSALAIAPLNAAALADRLHIDHRGARDFFDALVSLGLLSRDGNGHYENTKISDLHLDKAKPTYLGASFVQYNRREYAMWDNLTEALRTGRPRSELQGQDHFESIYKNGERFRSFVNAMTAGSLPSARCIAVQYPWEQFKTLCDVGTAQGCLPVAVALAHRHIEAIGFDLPELATAFGEYADEHGLSSRLQFKAGDFFRDPLPTADVIVFGRVLHNWDLDTKRMLLAKAYNAVAVGGAVIAYDMLIDDERMSGTGGLLSSLNMLLWTSGGFGYSGADCIGWMREVGFSHMSVEKLAGGNSMVIGRK